VGPHLFRRAHRHDETARIPPLGAQVDQPVAGADHIQVVLDHQQRMPGLQQLAQRAHELGDVVKVQAGGGFVEQEQRTLARHRLAAAAAGLGSLGQKAGQLQALRLAARQGGHGLTQLHVLQAHIHNGLQGAQHLAVAGKQARRLADREVQHIGHTQVAATALDLDLQDLGPIALAIAILAAQVDVGQELHLDVLEARTTAGGATAIAAVEAELAGGVAALAGHRCGGEDLTQRVPGAHIAHGVGARRLADGRLVDKHHIAQVIGAQ